MNDRHAWRLVPGKPCEGKDEYADMTLIRATRKRTMRQQKEDLANACYGCPVFTECLTDFKSLELQPTDHYGIRAGIIGRT